MRNTHMKKTTTILLLVPALFFLTQCTLSKLVIKNDDGKFKIKERMTVAVTSKDQTVYPYNESCKSTCKECDPLFQSSRLEIDSIGADALLLKRVYSYTYDTVYHEDYKLMHSKNKKENLYVILALEKKPVYVYKIPTEVEYEKWRYDELGSITYSYKSECYHGGPFQKMFADPNKIRRVKMVNHSIKTKIR